MERLANDVKNRNIVTTIPPLADRNTPVSVLLGFTLINFDYDESTQQLSMQGWFKMEWNDPRLSWSPEEYENISDIRAFPDSLWIPDYVVYNSAVDKNNAKDARPSLAVVNSSGKVLYIPPVTFAASCENNLRYWPFDTTTCTVKIGSWTHSVAVLEIHPSSEAPTDLTNLVQGKWNINKASTSIKTTFYEGIAEGYQSISYSLDMQRNSSWRQSTIIVPALAVAVLCLLAFFIPPTSSAKLLIGAIQGLLICGQLVYFDGSLSVNQGPTPLIVIFYADSLILVTLSLITSVVTFSWSTQPKSSGPPARVVQLLSGDLGRLLGGQTQDYGKSSGHGEKYLEADEQHNTQRQWLALSNATQRLSFFVYFFVFIVLISVCLMQN